MRMVIKFLRRLFSNDAGDSCEALYDRYWREHDQRWTYGIRIIEQCLREFPCSSLLDAGCGNGDVLHYLRTRGIDARGVDISLNAVRRQFPSFVEQGLVQESRLATLPFHDDSFDVTFCSEVLEHVPVDDVPKSLLELARVTRKHLFCTISLRPSSNYNAYHVTLRPRSWWERAIAETGLVRRTDVIDKLQVRQHGLTNKQVLLNGPTRRIMHELESFIQSEPYSFNGELEPWYFIYDKPAYE